MAEENETYQRISVPGASNTGETGKPMLPTVNRFVAIPATAGVKVEVEVNEEKTYADYLVYPAQHPEPKPDSWEGFNKNQEFYEEDITYPAELSNASPPAIMNDVRLVHLSIYPFRYNPKTRELTVATDITVHLDYSGYDERNVLRHRQTRFSPQWERLYQSLVLNFDDISHSTRAFNGAPWIPVEYLIIYAHDFRPEVCPKLQEFINWKARKGYFVRAVNLDSIPGVSGDTTDVHSLKEYIYDWWWGGGQGGWTHKDYVLLVGDAPAYHPIPSEHDWEFYSPVQCAYDSLIPTHGGYRYDWISGSEYWKYLFSDYYYQLLYGDDSLPEITLGRWCCRTPEELSVYVEKTMNYEMGGSSSWRPERAMYVAFRKVGDGGETYFQETKEYIADNIYTPYCELYAAEGAVTQDVIDEIESSNGVGIINYFGHGEMDQWWNWGEDEQPLTTAQLEALDNPNNYPIVYNIACKNGCITSPGQESVMVEAWTRNPGGGAAGALGSSLICWRPDVITLDSAIFRAHFDLDLNCGMAVNYSKDYLLHNHTPPDISNPFRVAAMYYWIGDPEMDVWRGKPFLTDHTIEFGNPITVRIVAQAPYIPIPGTKVCIHYDGGGYHEVRYTDECGCAYFPALGMHMTGRYYVTGTNQSPGYSIVPVRDSFIFHYSAGEQGQPLVDVIEWQLKPVQPNIVRSRATIFYSVAGRMGSIEDELVGISVFDATGSRVRDLVSDNLNPGHYTITWDCKDSRGFNCSSGVYFIRMDAEDFRACERTVLIK